jgi:hypothetical protein
MRGRSWPPAIPRLPGPYTGRPRECLWRRFTKPDASITVAPIVSDQLAYLSPSSPCDSTDKLNIAIV